MSNTTGTTASAAPNDTINSRTDADTANGATGVSPDKQKQTGKRIARPLNVLLPLIADDLKKGDEAARLAGLPYYRAAGEKLLEANADLTRRIPELGQTPL